MIKSLLVASALVAWPVLVSAQTKATDVTATEKSVALNVFGSQSSSSALAQYFAKNIAAALQADAPVVVKEIAINQGRYLTSARQLIKEAPAIANAVIGNASIEFDFSKHGDRLWGRCKLRVTDRRFAYLNRTTYAASADEQLRFELSACDFQKFDPGFLSNWSNYQDDVVDNRKVYGWSL